MIKAKVSLTQALKSQRQFIAETGSGHHLILDDAAGATGAKPIELGRRGVGGLHGLRCRHHAATEASPESDRL